MKYGKLTESIYERSVVKVMKANGAGLGTVCAALPYIEGMARMSLISGQAVAHGCDTDVARRAFLAAANRVAIQYGSTAFDNQSLAYMADDERKFADTAEDSSNKVHHSGLGEDLAKEAGGINFVGGFCANLTLSVPQRLREIKVRQFMEQVSKVAAEFAMPLADVHVQVLPGIEEPVASCVVSGVCQRYVENHASVGEDIIMTKWLGLEGTAVIADKHYEELCGRYPADIVKEARNFGRYCSIIPEAATAVKSNAGALFAVREGGIFGGLWSLAAGSGVGLVVDLKSIPIRQETIEVCEFFDCNPYELLSGGSLLITAKDGRELVYTLNRQGISAAVIGKITAGNDRIIRHGEETRFLEPAKEDAIYKILGKQ